MDTTIRLPLDFKELLRLLEENDVEYLPIRDTIFAKLSNIIAAMTDQVLLERITLNPNVLLGKPVIRGTRLSVEFILNLLAHGATESEILEEYEGLTQEDIRACLLFAGESLSRAEFMPLIVESA